MTARGGIYGDLHGDGKPVAVATQPDSIPAEWIQTAALAVYETARDLGKRDATAEWADAPERYRNAAIAYATAAITILRPLIEAETRERCAHACEELGRNAYEGTKAVRHYMACAAMIRELPA